MKVLAMPGIAYGDFVPMTTVARALCQRQAHKVTFILPERSMSMALHAGFDVFGFPSAAPPAEPGGDRPQSLATGWGMDSWIRRNVEEVNPLPVRTRARMLGGWGADCVLVGEFDVASMLACELANIPCVVVGVHATGIGDILTADIRADFAARREACGLPHADLEQFLYRHLMIVNAPSTFRPPLPIETNVVRVRPEPLPPRSGLALNLGGRHLIWAHIGSSFNRHSGDMLPTILHGLAGVGNAVVIATTGEDVDPDFLRSGDLPEHLYLERFVDAVNILPHCNLVIHPGGSSTMVLAAKYGVPQLMFPLGADHPENTARAVELGIALALDPWQDPLPYEIEMAAYRLLYDPAHRVAAERIQHEIAAMPDADNAVDAIERLVATASPTR